MWLTSVKDSIRLSPVCDTAPRMPTIIVRSAAHISRPVSGDSGKRRVCIETASSAGTRSLDGRPGSTSSRRVALHEHVAGQQAQLAMVAGPVVVGQAAKGIAAQEDREGVAGRHAGRGPADDDLVSLLAEGLGGRELREVGAYQRAQAIALQGIQQGETHRGSGRSSRRLRSGGTRRRVEGLRRM